MKGKEQSKINGKIVKDLEKHINGTGKAMLVVPPVSIKMNEPKSLSNYFCEKESIKEDLTGHFKFKRTFPKIMLCYIFTVLRRRVQNLA